MPVATPSTPAPDAIPVSQRYALLLKDAGGLASSAASSSSRLAANLANGGSAGTVEIRDVQALADAALGKLALAERVRRRDPGAVSDETRTHAYEGARLIEMGSRSVRRADVLVAGGNPEARIQAAHTLDLAAVDFAAALDKLRPSRDTDPVVASG